jgi:hypothetical protein
MSQKTVGCVCAPPSGLETPSDVASLGLGGAAVCLLVQYRARKKTWSGGDCGLLIGDAQWVIPFRKVIVTAHPSSQEQPQEG